MAIGRPDWTSITLIKGLDAEENLLTVLVDKSRALIAVIKGDHLGTLKTVATDVEGRMIAVTRRSLGGSGLDGVKNVTEDTEIDPDRWYDYSSLTVAEGATLGLSAPGKMFVRVAGTVTVNGTISVKGKGGLGGAVAASGVSQDGNPGAAESKGGLCGGGGGGGNDGIGALADGGDGGGSEDDGCGAGGAGGAKGASAVDGGDGGAFNFDYDIRHDFEEDWDYFALNRGPGGGAGGTSYGWQATGAGGNGGSILYLEAFKIIVNGTITADGDDGLDGNAGGAGLDGGGGAGAGGSIVLIAREFEFVGTITADGGAGGVGGDAGEGGAGADGIIKTAVVY